MADYLGKKIKFNIEDNDLQKIRFNKAYGESQQATRSGKNFLENTGVSNTSNGVTFTINDDKTILVDGNNDGTANSSFIINNYSLKAGTYILNGCPSGGSSTTYRLPIQKTSDWSILGLDTGSGSEQFTIDEATKIQVAIFIQKGQTISNLLFKPMIRLSSIIDDTYEQYGVMPSPDYPSPIENVEGKNKLPLPEKENENFRGATISIKEGVITLDGTTTDSGNYRMPSFQVEETGNYCFSRELSQTTTGIWVLLDESTDNSTWTGIIDWGFSELSKSAVVNLSTEKYYRIRIFTNAENTFDNLTIKLQLEEGTVATPYVPYNSLEFKDEGKNLVKQMNWKQLPSISTGATVTTVYGYGTDFIEVDNTKNYVFSYSGTANSRYIVYYDKNKNFLGYYTNLQTNNFAKWSETGYVRLRVDCPQDSVTAFQLEEGTVATDYEPYKSQTAYFPLLEGQKLYKNSYLADDGTHHKRKQVVLDGTETGWYTSESQTGTNTSYFYIPISDMKKASTLICDKFINRAVWNTDEEAIQSIIDNLIRLRINTSRASTVAELKTWLSNNPITVEYELAEEEIVPYTAEQQEAWEKLRHFKGLNGENNITVQGTMTSTLDLTLYNIAEEDFDIYISKKGYFGALKYDINNLIDFMESNIPSIAEATESSVKIAGRDGDISLNTVYEPLPFEIVCYTEDNLTPEEKIIEEQKITSLLNSIKNQPKTFFMEREKKFYKVKYSGNLSVVRYPKHLKFTIPLKSSESYAMNFEESEIIGNGTKVSNTIKDTGAIFTIKGPATKPIISLNNYQMKYNENILEGNSLIINSEDSTITHITSAGVKTNAMRAYNHEFPKIKNGENQLAVSSGIDDENQVNVKWYDLKI